MAISLCGYRVICVPLPFCFGGERKRATAQGTPAEKTEGMSLTSIAFFAGLILSIGLYYLFYGKGQWILLLLFSAAFFLVSSPAGTWGFFLAAAAVTFVCGRAIAYFRENRISRAAGAALVIGIAVDAALLLTLKYGHFLAENENLLLSALHVNLNIREFALPAPVGISFYTLSLIAYLVDVYWGLTKPQSAPLRFLLFSGYYPLMTSGPIVHHEQLAAQLAAPHRFDWKNVTFGLQRVLWGVFKKLVISVRCGVIADAVYADPEQYAGLYIWIAAALFMMQLYTDFSGCMDIVIGASECYGIVLPENFRSPFFAQSVQEFWQRWHMTLGNWARDYIMYPLLRLKVVRGWIKWMSKHISKSFSRKFPTYVAMLPVWLFIGLWHGSDWKYILGMGIWFWLCIVLGEVLAPLFQAVTRILRFRTDNFSFRVFRSLRVFALVAIGNMFFRLPSIRETIRVLRLGVSIFNPWIFVDGTLFSLGLNKKNIAVMMAALFVLFVVSVLDRKEDVRERIARQGIVYRWSLFILLIWVIAVFGVYGPGFVAADFIYEQF